MLSGKKRQLRREPRSAQVFVIGWPGLTLDDHYAAFGQVTADQIDRTLRRSLRRARARIRDLAHLRAGLRLPRSMCARYEHRQRGPRAGGLRRGRRRVALVVRPARGWQERRRVPWSGILAAGGDTTPCSAPGAVSLPSSLVMPTAASRYGFDVTQSRPLQHWIA